MPGYAAPPATMMVPNASADATKEAEEKGLLVGKSAASMGQTVQANFEKAIWIAAWMMVSMSVILSCKWIFISGGFPFPLALTYMHMVCCSVIFGAIRRFAPRRVKLAIMPDAEVHLSWEAYCKGILPVAFFFALTLGLGQSAYLFASVSFVQMIKPINVICASIAAFAIGMETPTWTHMIIVVIVALGVLVATASAAQFSGEGCLLQVLSSVSEGARLACVQRITTTMKLDPVSTVYYYSMPSAILLGMASLMVEKQLDFSMLSSPYILMINCVQAVVLNVLVATVIKKTSAVIFTLCGIVKDLTLVGSSVVFFATPITTYTVYGYAIAVMGLCMYKAYKDNLELFRRDGFLRGMYAVCHRTNGKAV